MTAKETIEILNKQWVDASDIRKLALYRRNKEFEIKRIIRNKILDKGYLLPTGYVPTVNVIEYLKIDIKYLESRALCEDKLNKS